MRKSVYPKLAHAQYNFEILIKMREGESILIEEFLHLLSALIKWWPFLRVLVPALEHEFVGGALRGWLRWLAILDPCNHLLWTIQALLRKGQQGLLKETIIIAYLVESGDR